MIVIVIVAIATRRRLHRLQIHLDRALYRVSHDPLTGLPNREGALTHLSAGPVHLVGLLDLDDFKSINDRHGHHVGDDVLITIAERLSTAIAGHGIAARLAGDEFLILWTRPVRHPLREGAALLEEVCAPLSTIDGHRLTPWASLGLARPGPTPHDPAAWIANADEAMYEAKHPDPHPDTDPADTAPRVHLHTGTHPPQPLDRTFPRRRARRDRPIDDAGSLVPGEDGVPQ